MKKMAAVITFLILVAGDAVAQSGARVRYEVKGLVVAPHEDFQDDFEIRLVNDNNVVVATVKSHTLQEYNFPGLQRGTYYVEVEIPGFKTLRERVDLDGSAPDVNVPIILEAQRESAPKKPISLIGDELVVDAGDLAPPASVFKRFRESIKKLQKGDVVGATSRLESLVRDTPEFYDGHKTLGVAYQQSRLYPNAEKEYETARGLRPLSSAPLILLGSLYLEQYGAGDRNTAAEALLDSARAVLLDSIQLSPEAAFGHYLLGVTYSRLGLYKDAEKSLLHALDLEPHLGEAQLALANVYIHSQVWGQALSQIDAFLRDNPRSPNRQQVVETRKQIEAVTDSKKSPGLLKQY